MSQRIKGARRKATDRAIREILAWRPFYALCESHGISRETGRAIKRGYVHKQPCPESRK
jgi:hypothetical protein